MPTRPPPSGESSGVLVALLIVAVVFLIFLCVHFWRESVYLREHCSFIPDNMMEVPNE